VRRVTGQKQAPLAIAVSDDRRRLPIADPKNFDRQIGLSDPLADQLDASSRREIVRGVAVLPQLEFAHFVML
jgi:hypothetical protein